MSNKNAASEDEIGLLHGLITKCHNLKASYMIKVADQILETGGEPEEVVQAINSRDLSSIQKWVEYNGVGCRVAADDETSELSKKLKKLREAQSGKIVQFKSLEEEATG